MQVKFVGAAKLDLREIAKHYRDVGGNPLALRMIRLIRSEIALLADNPKIAPPYELVAGIHRYVIANGAYLAFYRELANVEVLHVRRSERAPAAEADLDRHSPGAEHLDADQQPEDSQRTTIA